MRKLSLKHLIAALMALTLVIFIGVSVSVAGKAIKAGGKIKASYTEQKEFEIGDVDGHRISFTTSEGINTSTGDIEMLDGASIINYSLDDLVNGSGSGHGYIKVMKENDGMISKWEHKVVTTMTDEGTPSTAFEGTFKYTGGMGKYSNITGGGTYKGMFVSKTEYVVEWQGEYSLGE
ncbi:MAG: hypothetical protein GY839_03275 [candidate division Zixibacteria bacterium]|nr:hypothetical protein [candidate division Zixibacteria bacterium]